MIEILNGYKITTLDSGTVITEAYSDQALTTLDDLKKSKNGQLIQWHDSQTQAMKAKYSNSEVESFLDKRNEAMAWRVDNTVATPYVTAMSGGNDVVRIMLLNSILSKVDATAQLEAFVLMTRDAIEACTTQEQLEAIVW